MNIRIYFSATLLFLIISCLPSGYSADKTGKRRDFKGHSTVEQQFSDCDKLLNEAQRSASGVPGAGSYVNQARQILNQAKADYYRWYNSQQGQLQTTDPFGDYLFKGVPFRPPDGKLVVRHFNEDELTSRAEEWSKQMKQIIGKIDNIRKSDEASLSGEVEKMLKVLGGGKADPAAQDTLGGKVRSEVSAIVPPPTLVNPYANDPNVVDLTGSKTLTPSLLRKPESDTQGYPLAPDPGVKQYSEMSDEQLKKKQDALEESIRKLQKLSDDNIKGYNNVTDGAKEGKGLAVDASIDSLLTVVSMNNSEILKELGKPEKLTLLNYGAGYFSDSLSVLDSGLKEDYLGGAQTISFMVGDAALNEKAIGKLKALKHLTDTAYVWSDYLMLSIEQGRQEKIRNDLDLKRKELSEQLNQIIAERKKRAAGSGR